MTINLSEIEFTNDFFNFITPRGDELILNKINESLKIGENTDDSLDIDVINIELIKSKDEVSVSCPCIIGMGNDYIHLDTDYKEYEGDVLTSSNMKYCTMTVYE